VNGSLFLRPFRGLPKSRVYLVCDGCGFFYGDIRLYPDAVVKCEECGSEAAWAFPHPAGRLRRARSRLEA
jgi:hypothetical protein